MAAVGVKRTLPMLYEVYSLVPIFCVETIDFMSLFYLDLIEIIDLVKFIGYHFAPLVNGSAMLLYLVR